MDGIGIGIGNYPPGVGVNHPNFLNQDPGPVAECGECRLEKRVKHMRREAK